MSIGAFEHFARQGLSRVERRAVYRSFFDRCWLWLDEGGRLSLQTIAYEDFDPSTGPVSSFFTEEIFPESALPQLSDIIEATEECFRLLAFRSDPNHYQQTLRLWQKRLEENEVKATNLVGRETYRRYLRYLRVSRAMFDRKVCTLYRMIFERRPVSNRTLGNEVNPALREALDECAGRLLDRHLSHAKEWFPHELVPWELGRRCVPGETPHMDGPALADGVMSALFVNLLTEDNLPHYFHCIAASVGTRFGSRRVEPTLGG